MSLKYEPSSLPQHISVEVRDVDGLQPSHQWEANKTVVDSMAPIDLRAVLHRSSFTREGRQEGNDETNEK